MTHRAWFSPAEYKLLYEATRERARNPRNERWRGECEQFHDYVLFMVNTGLRPDEASRLEYRDVSVVVDVDTEERILEIEVRGKRGVGYCKSMPGAVQPYLRMRKRNNPRETELIFGKVQRELMNAILSELNLKKDRDGNARTAYSLRHTYICLRLMEGADIYQIAKNCRTSVEMIETYYASHIKNTLDASAINVRKAPRKARSAQGAGERQGAQRRTPPLGIDAHARSMAIQLRHAGVAKLVDATDLDRSLSAPGETPDVEPLKVGEPCQMAIPSQAPHGEGVETRRAAPKA